LKILGPFKSGILFFWKDPENVDLHDLAQEINKIQGKSFKFDCKSGFWQMRALISIFGGKFCGNKMEMKMYLALLYQ
jgi:hypothetical protein